MEYERFVVRAFEQEPGKWRASIRRADGKPVKIIGGKKLEQGNISGGERTAAAALLTAMGAIDAGTPARGRVATENFGAAAGSFPEIVAAKPRQRHRMTARRLNCCWGCFPASAMPKSSRVAAAILPH